MSKNTMSKTASAIKPGDIIEGEMVSFVKQVFGEGVIVSFGKKKKLYDFGESVDILVDDSKGATMCSKETKYLVALYKSASYELFEANQKLSEYFGPLIDDALSKKDFDGANKILLEIPESACRFEQWRKITKHCE